MRSFYELEVTVQSADDIDDPSHCEISVQPAYDAVSCDQFPDDDEAARLAGLRHAGTLGRLSFALRNFIDWERQTHGCGGHALIDPSDHMGGWWGACSISGAGLVDPGAEECYQPALWIVVPESQRRAWLERIRTTLAVIAEADMENRP